MLLIIDFIHHGMPVIAVSCCHFRESQVDQDTQEGMASQDALLVQDLKNKCTYGKHQFLIQGNPGSPGPKGATKGQEQVPYSVLF